MDQNPLISPFEKYTDQNPVSGPFQKNSDQNPIKGPFTEDSLCMWDFGSVAKDEHTEYEWCTYEIMGNATRKILERLLRSWPTG